MVNISASPYRMGVMGTRREMLNTRSGDNQCLVAYVNQVGANDGLIFDGGGFVVQNGRPMLEAPRWREGVASVVVDLDRTQRLRTENTTWRTDCLEARAQPSLPKVVRAEGTGADRVRCATRCRHGSFFLPRPRPRAAARARSSARTCSTP
jgi:NAD+ synthase (glutamine-hydrolysing)